MTSHLRCDMAQPIAIIPLPFRCCRKDPTEGIPEIDVTPLSNVGKKIRGMTGIECPDSNHLCWSPSIKPDIVKVYRATAELSQQIFHHPRLGMAVVDSDSGGRV